MRRTVDVEVAGKILQLKVEEELFDAIWQIGFKDGERAGRQQAILHQCNHDLAAREAYQQGAKDVAKYLIDKNVQSEYDIDISDLCLDFQQKQIKEQKHE